MDIGTEKETITIEPAEDPCRPAEPIEIPAPSRTPAEPVEVPA